MGRQVLLMDIGAGLAIIGEVSPGEQGLPWAAAFVAAGGLGDYSWEISGDAPVGADFAAVDDQATLIADTLGTAGYYSFSLKLTDNVLRRSVTRSFTVFVNLAYEVIEFLLTEDGGRLLTESGTPLGLEA